NPAPPEFCRDVDALNPPEVAVSPIAPFMGNHQLASYPPIELGNEVDGLSRIGDRRAHATFEFWAIQREMFSFLGQSRVEIGDAGRIRKLCGANSHSNIVGSTPSALRCGVHLISRCSYACLDARRPCRVRITI